MMSESRVLFLTGSTGVLGKDFVREILATSEDQLYLLIRRKGIQSHWARARKILASFGRETDLGTRVHAVSGDVTLPGLGIQPHDREDLRRKVTDFFHVAALTTLNAPEAECMRINYEGTKEALQIAWDLRKNGKLKRFFYFSTAYVSGSRQTFHAPEDGLTPTPAFANYYESSKYRSEGLVREAMAQGLPVTIFRPSIVVGHSKTGEVGDFNVIYPFMKLFAHGILRVLPTRLENSFNIVPVDFVIQASDYISRQPDSVGKTYHLVSPEPPTIGMLLQLTREEYSNMPPVEIIPPENFEKSKLDVMEQVVFEMLEPYLGYLNDHLTFETKNTEAVLSASGIELPKTDYAFLKILTQYAVDQGYLVLN